MVHFRPSARAVARYVAQGGYLSHARGETFFEGVQELPAGHYALITHTSRVPRRYWSLPTDVDGPSPSTDEALAGYSDLFTDSVRLRLRADVPVGTCLSGGLDSSSIVAVAGQLMQTEHAVSLERLGDHQQTFSAVYSDDGPWNERRYVEEVVESVAQRATTCTPLPNGSGTTSTRLSGTRTSLSSLRASSPSGA